MIKYAGIGSRQTPHVHLAMMRSIGFVFGQRGFILRSGAAIGADKAFEQGCDVANGKKEIFRPNQSNSRWESHAAYFHPAWNKCSKHSKALHGRNSAIMFGFNLNDPVAFVVCWTKDGCATGGTGQALRIAYAHNIPIFNLFKMPNMNALMRWIDRHVI